MSDGEFSGKVAIVTGASRGIGEATARLLAERGASVVLLARGAEEIERIAGEIDAAGGTALARVCDVADWAAVDSAVAATEAMFGAPNILINNAGVIEPIAPLSESDPAGWGAAIDINVKGVYHGIRAVLPGMIARGAGTIVNVGSGAATSPLEGWSHYCAGKAAVLMLTRSAHLEVAEKGVTVVGLSPGTVRTEMQVAIKASGINPVSQLDPDIHIPPEAAARGILHLCGPAGAAHAGGDFSLRTEEGKRAAGLA